MNIQQFVVQFGAGKIFGKSIESRDNNENKDTEETNSIKEIIENDIILIGSCYFLANDEMNHMLKNRRILPAYAGTYLGKEEKKRFIPSIFLLELLRNFAKTATANEKAAWLFVCKRDILKEGIVSTSARENELVIVLNSHNEVLGYGKFAKGYIKNYFDIGDFLRRQRKNI